MNLNLYSRFSVMMFLQYAIPGSIMPILTHYLKNYVGFEPYQVGIIMAMPPLAAMVSLPISAFLSDRFISTERLLALYHAVIGCATIWLVAQDEFTPVLLLYFVFGMAFTPTLALSNATVLHHTANAQRDFGNIRLWGTAGWVAVSWIFGYGWLRGGGDERLPHALILAGIVGFTLSAYCLTLPKAPAATQYGTAPIDRRALPVLLKPGMAALCVLTMLNSMVHQFYYYGMGPYLSQAGYPNRAIMPFMSLGQLAEIGFMAALGLAITRWGIKRVLIIGAAAQVARTVIFGLTTAAPVVLPGIALHGVCYAFFFTAAYIYLDGHATPQTRSGAQQLFTIVINGFGQLLGFLLAGACDELFTDNATGVTNYTAFWFVSATVSVGIVTGLALLLPNDDRDSDKAGA